jgi:hypothetical protein
MLPLLLLPVAVVAAVVTKAAINTAREIIDAPVL